MLRNRRNEKKKCGAMRHVAKEPAVSNQRVKPAGARRQNYLTTESEHENNVEDAAKTKYSTSPLPRLAGSLISSVGPGKQRNYEG